MACGRQNLEFNGIPKGENENLLSKVNELVSNKLDVPVLCKDEIVPIQSLTSTPGKIPESIVQFATQQTRAMGLGKKDKPKETVSYMSESMTKRNETLLNTTRNRSRENS